MSRPFRLTVKSQVTVPKDVRDALGVKPGDDVTFDIDGDRVALRKANKPERDEAVASFRQRLARARASFPALPTDMTTDEYMAMIREPVPTPRSQ